LLSLVEIAVTFLLLLPILLAIGAISASVLADFQRGRRIRRLLRTFDEGLSVLGRGSVKAIYDHLRKEYTLVREDIPARLGLFHTSLENLLGPKGATLVEKQIAKNMCLRLKLKYEERSPWDFAGYVRAAMQRLKIL
jgi:hypothetical protein